MSDRLRVALVAEGPTDRIVVDSVLRASFPGRPFVLRQLQPEGSAAFKELGTGWCGVYRWCRQAARRGDGSFRTNSLLFLTYDLLIVHLDADVAGQRYDDCGITPDADIGALPCLRACPPASATTDALRAVLLSWLGESDVPPSTVLCVPSMSTEAWVVAALYPKDEAMRNGIECYPRPETRLAQQPKKSRISKTQRDYEGKSTQLTEAWGRLAGDGRVGEASRFQKELLAAVGGGVPGSP